MFHIPPAVTGEVVSMTDLMIWVSVLVSGVPFPTVYFLQSQISGQNTLLSHALYIRFQVKRHDSCQSF